MLNNEIIKFIDADIIYPILDSKWVSPIHVVLKKGGIMIVGNGNNERIPTRLVMRRVTLCSSTIKSWKKCQID